LPSKKAKVKLRKKDFAHLPKEGYFKKGNSQVIQIPSRLPSHKTY
jgi:hypothetical protein